VREGITMLLALFFLLLSSFTAWTEQTSGENKETTVDKILNPLPDYNPFVENVSPPKFFPDGVDQRVRQALIDSLTDREGTMVEHVRYFREKDAELLGERDTVTGLTGHVLDLRNNTIRDHQGYLAAQRQALASASTEQQKNLIQSRIRNDEATQAEELLRKNRTDKWGAFINRLLSSVDLVSIFSGSYVGAAVDSTVSQLLALGSAEMSVAERKALTLYLKHLKRYPEDPKRKEILEITAALQEKKKRVLVQTHLEEAEEAISNGELTRAELHYEMAIIIDPASSEAKEGIEKLAERVREEAEEKNKALSSLEEISSPEGVSTEDRDLRDLLYALALGDPGQIEAQAAAIGEKHRGDSLGESARDALAVAMEIKGQHEKAKGMLESIAGSSASPLQKKKAKALLENPDYNLLASFQKARTQHRLQTVKYVLLGENFLEKNLLLGASPLITQGVAGASTLGVANLLIVGTNLFQLITTNPIPTQPIIDRGVAYIRSHPESENASDVYRILAKAYEEGGAYNQALAYYKLSGTASEEEISDLIDKAAKALLQAAERSKDQSKKELYLRAILEYYPESSAAKEATRKLAHQLKARERGMKISKKFLMENPELYGPGGLGLKASLFDGNINNMELADRGLNVLSRKELLVYFKTQWGIQSRTYPVSQDAVDRFKLALREKHYEIAMGDIHTRTQGSPGGISNLPPHFLSERQDRKTRESEKPNLSLVKKATSSPRSFSKVLDYELLTENEKNPASKFNLPEIHGSVSASGFAISGALPSALWGDRVTLGADAKSPFAGLQLPIPLLQDFIPIDFLLQGRPGRPSLIPRIHRFYKEEGEDAYLYR